MKLRSGYMVNRKKIIELRQERGLTQYELAEVAGISVVTLNKIETSELARPFPTTLKKIATALGVAIEDLKEDNNEFQKDTYYQVNTAMKKRASVVNSIMEIDEFQFAYIWKQVEIFRRNLGSVFGISDSMLLEAALFAGLSWSRPGETTHKCNFSKVLGDLLALKNNEIEIKRVDIPLRSMEELENYSEVSGVYGICDRDGTLLRIGQTTNLAKRLKEHIIELEKEEYPAMKEYITSKDIFGENYYFSILTFEPNVGKGLSAFQAEVFRYYAETRLIIQEKTYLKGNSYKGKAIFTGDIYIPIHVQQEMIRYYYGIEL